MKQKISSLVTLRYPTFARKDSDSYRYLPVGTTHRGLKSWLQLTLSIHFYLPILKFLMDHLKGQLPCCGGLPFRPGAESQATAGGTSSRSSASTYPQLQCD